MRRLFVEAVQEEDVTRFVFVDETSTTLTYCRRYGRAPAGRRLHQTVPLRGGPNVTLIAALTSDGLGALLSVDGVVNGDVFAAHMDQVLGSTLRPGDVVVLDNLAVHKVDGLNEIAKNTGYACTTCHLIRQISTRLNALSASSKRGCARPKHAPATCLKRRFWPPPHG